MNRGIAIGVLALLVAAAGIAVAGVGSLSTLGSGGAGGPSAEPAPGAGDPTAGQPGGSGVAPTPGNASTADPFEFRVTEVSNCGLTCREVTVALTNTGDVPVRNVQVDSVVTAGDQQIVQRTAHVDRIAPGATVKRTVRVNAGFGDALAIRQNGGYVTIDVTVTSDRFRETFSTRRKVL